MTPSEANPASGEAFRVENLSAGYHGAAVLHDLNLSVPAGQIAGVLGPNGAGKSTLLRCLTGLCRPLRGRVRLFGADLAALAPDERARVVAVVPQQLETPMPFTVQEVVMVGRTASLSRWSAPNPKDRAAAERAMVYTDVVDMKDRPFGELSGGERQRVVVAMALAREPRALLLDEATSHLDLNHRLEVLQIVERLNRERGVTVLMVSHDLSLASEFCRRLVLLDKGRVVSDGPPAEVLQEDTLRQVYRCEVRVIRDPASGSLTVLPARRLADERCGEGIRVHMVAGGGAGEEVLRRLCLCEYAVTAGVLNRGDSDAEVAEALGVETVLERPFSPISPGVLAAARELAAPCDALIVCGVPFGPANLANLDLADLALANGKPVFVMAGVEERDYTPGRKAVEKNADLVRRGAVVWRDITALLGHLARLPR
jgi:iron complex transport system ATP-binding protein